MTPRRLPTGGLVRRDQALDVIVGGTALPALVGDTAASAALASGDLRVGDSIYRRRPRGVFTDGIEEPNAFVRHIGAHGQNLTHHESMLPATSFELRDGDRLQWEDGIGELSHTEDPAEYDHKHVHTDVAVVGAGPAGLAAARAAARVEGQRVILFEQDFELGGRLLSDPTQEVEGFPATEWIAAVREELEKNPEVRILTRSGVFGSYDSNFLMALEKRLDAPRRPGVSRQRVWHVRADRVVLATGALERTLVFARNDLPGVMLASAVRTYLGRYGVLVGDRAVIATTNDTAYPLATQLREAGADVTIVDARPEADIRGTTPEGVTVHASSVVVSAEGTEAVTGVRIMPRAADGSIGGEVTEIPADVVAVAGGWTPNVALHSQRQGSLAWDDRLVGFVPSERLEEQYHAGSLLGTSRVEDCLAEGEAAGRGEVTDRDTATRAEEAGVQTSVWLARESEDQDLGEHFVDFQRDNTAKDVQRAIGAGMRSVEHVKRYTSISTGVEQGKVGGVLTIGLMTELLSDEDMAAMPAGQPGQSTYTAEYWEGGEPSSEVLRPSPGAIGTTTYRAPFTPVAFAALAGRYRGELYDAVRRTPAYDRLLERGAAWEDVGQWKRAWYFPQDGEDMDAAVARECRAAREGVGVLDATTLGKIEVRGKDAPEFLNRMYTNAFKKLAPGKQRYGVMCKPDGMVLDDGVTFRISEDRYLLTTTTGGAAGVYTWLEEFAQTEWPELDVVLTSVTEQYATVTVVGPKSRAVVEKIAPDLDVSNEAFGFMEWRDTVLGSGIAARICRVTFTGDLSFEINVPNWYGEALWDDVMEAGEEFGITPYGTETMHVLRAEKAYPIIGQDTDGTVTPQDLGMDWVVSKKKDFVGNRSFHRKGHVQEGRKQLVALLPEDHDLVLPEGTQIIALEDTPDSPLTGPARKRIPMLGQVTSSYRSQAIDRSFALALVKDGRARVGTRLTASFDGKFFPVEVHESVVFDKEGARRDG